MAVTRIRLAVNKKQNALKGTKKEIATLLQNGKEDKARVKAETVIREENFIDALDYLETVCELVAERSQFIASLKECPEDMMPTFHTLIYASFRSEIAELLEVREQFGHKYGASFVSAAADNTWGKVDPRIVDKMKLTPPATYLVLQTLEEIAGQHNVDWTAPEDYVMNHISAPAPPAPNGAVAANGPPAQTIVVPPGAQLAYILPSGATVPVGMTPTAVMPTASSIPGSGLPTYQMMSPHAGQSPVMMAPAPGVMPQAPPPSYILTPPPAGAPPVEPLPAKVIPTEAQAPSPPPPAGPSTMDFPAPPTHTIDRDNHNSGGSGGGEAPNIPDLDALTARFEALKKRK
eukprot:GILK01001673.1.p1 GENE.GILK01001673.1~~GILK01001673.1.p1  ORF type:complete len:385 (-),score=58.76 GILK01001673.1:134-1174(-)